MKITIRLLAVAKAMLCGALLIVPLQAEAMKEFELKARVLSVIGNYVVWPKPAALDPARPFIIAVIGESPMARDLKKILSEKTVQNRKVTLVFLPRFRENALNECDLLFLCSSEMENLPKILSYFKGRPTLTIADTPDFARRGVMINLLVQEGNLGLEVNLKAVRQAGLEVSASFLALPKEKTRLVEGP